MRLTSRSWSFRLKKKRKNESEAVFKMRRLRGLALGKALSGLTLNEMLNVKVRNSVEHFADYLDQANVELAEAPTAPAPLAAYNITISGWAIMAPRPFPVRVYVADVKRFHNLRFSINLGRLHDEARSIRERLLTLPQLAGVQAPSGLMVPLESRDEARGKRSIEIRRKRK